MAGGVDQMRKGTTVMVILSLLVEAREPLHGYEIIRRLRASSQGLFTFKEGLVYPALHRMEQEGLLVGRWVNDESTRRRKLYGVTDLGRRRLEQDIRRWQTLSQSINRLLGLELAQP
jgi:PadR family transcriptional regulator PadR